MAYFYPQYLEEIERTRKGAATKALTGRDVDPFAQALEVYGTTAARLSEERARSTQIKKEYLQSKGQRMVERQQKQNEASQAVSGVGSLALTGYQAGKSLGLWGAGKGVGTLTDLAPGVPTSVAETGLTTASATVPEMVPGGGAALLPETVPGSAVGFGASALAPEVVPAALPVATATTEAAGLVGGSGLGIGTAIGVEAAGATTAAAATGGILESVAAPTILEMLAPLFPFIGCFCYIFKEGNNGYLEDDVRRYRDEHYPKGGDVDYGYRWMASWLVPLMKRNKVVKYTIKFFMLNPLAYYARWYYGHNKYGFLCWPAKSWVMVWKMVGRSIKPVVQGMFLQLLQGNI